jgi:23S rRNA (adenine2503-C2)-methyltransferase
MKEKTDLKTLSSAGMLCAFLEKGLPRFRTGQLLHWMYRKYASDIDEVTEFSRGLREDLGKDFFIGNLNIKRRLRSSDGTEKFLFSLLDGETVESVLIPDGDRLTLCVSSQVGCAMGCLFCLTGKLGFIRNLKAHEMVDQVISAARSLQPGEKITNIVLMGMGEPLANFEEVMEALRRITGLMGISGRRITLSTSGLAPKIAALGEQAPDVNLAVSLNATTDESRDRLMPVNRRYPLKSLIDACRKFPLKPRRRITFEYVLIDCMNDSQEDARRLVRLVKGLRCKINLIPYNPHGESDLNRPTEIKILDFQKILTENHLTALIRESKGRDILAACGQLKAGY